MVRSAEAIEELDEREKEGGPGEMEHETIATAPSTPPSTVEQAEESEPHSEANSPPLSSPLSEDLEAEDLEKGQSPSPYSERVGELRFEEVQINPNPAENKASPNNTDTDIGQGPGPDAKVTTNRSIQAKIPVTTHLVTSAVKKVSFTTPSLPSGSSSIYSPKSRWRGTTHQMKIIEVILRFGGAVLSLIAFSVMTATSEVRSGAGSTFKMKFTDYQAYNYLVAVNVISFIYSCWQLVLLGRSSFSEVFSTYNYNKILIIYVCDQVLAFLLFSASTAAATAAQLSRHGLHNIWPPACSTWKLWLFCSKADAAVVMSFFCSFFVISSSLFSGYHLSKALQE